MVSIFLKFERNTVGQTSWKSQYLPGGENCGLGRQRTMPSTLGAKEDCWTDTEVSKQPTAECSGHVHPRESKSCPPGHRKLSY